MEKIFIFNIKTMKEKVIKKPMKYTLIMHDKLRNETTIVAKFSFLGDAILCMKVMEKNVGVFLKYEIQTRFS